MPLQRLSDEQMRKMTPEERIKYLRALEEEQKAQAEEAKRKADEEISAAEELIKRSQSEIEEEELEDERERKEAHKEPVKEERKQESIDDLLNGERAAQANGQYRTDRPDYAIPGQENNGASPLYAALGTAAQTLDRLAGQNTWDPNDQRAYSDAKQNIERASQYQLSGDRLQEELGLAQHALNRLKYQH